MLPAFWKFKEFVSSVDLACDVSQIAAMAWKILTGLGAPLGIFFAYAAARGGVDIAVQDGKDLLFDYPPEIVSVRPSNTHGMIRAIVRNPSNRDAVILAVEGRQQVWSESAEAMAVENAVENIADNSMGASLERVESQMVDAKPQKLCADAWKEKLDQVVNLKGRATGRLVIPVKGDLTCSYEIRVVTTRGESDWAPVED